MRLICCCLPEGRWAGRFPEPVAAHLSLELIFPYAALFATKHFQQQTWISCCSDCLEELHWPSLPLHETFALHLPSRYLLSGFYYRLFAYIYRSDSAFIKPEDVSASIHMILKMQRGVVSWELVLSRLKVGKSEHIAKAIEADRKSMIENVKSTKAN